MIAKAWQTGVVLESPTGQSAEITVDPNENSLVVCVSSIVVNSVPKNVRLPASNPSAVAARREKMGRLYLPTKPLPKPPSVVSIAQSCAPSSDAFGTDRKCCADCSSHLSPRKPCLSDICGFSLRDVHGPGVEGQALYFGAGSDSPGDLLPSSPSRSPRGVSGSWARVVKPNSEVRSLESSLASPARSPRAGSVRVGSGVSRSFDAIRASRGAERACLVKQVVEQVTGLLDAVFEASSGVEIRAFVACPHCMSDAFHYLAPTYFAFSDCVDAVVSSFTLSVALTCMGEPVSVDLLDEDLTFRYVTVFSEEEVALEQQHFASGGLYLQGSIHGKWAFDGGKGTQA